jgi:F-type H+-transporting ATPase subunit a
MSNISDIATEAIEISNDPIYIQWWESPKVYSLIVVVVIITLLFLLYFLKIRDVKRNVYPRSFAFVFQIYIEFIHNTLVEVMGPKFEKFTPYFIYLFTYIFICNTVSILGFESPTGTITMTLSLALVTWLGIFVIGFKYQKVAFLKKFCFNVKIKGKQIPVMINPLNIAGQFAPLMSLTFRLWGNVFAGSIILTLVLSATSLLSALIPIFNWFDLIGAIILIFLHAYFDIISGAIQALVFTLLTMIYWKLETVEV